MYRQTSSAGRAWFEVVIVQHHDGREVFGAFIEPAEYYPPTSQWGTLGWTFTEVDREGADRMFDQLCARELAASELQNKP